MRSRTGALEGRIALDMCKLFKKLGGCELLQEQVAHKFTFPWEKCRKLPQPKLLCQPAVETRNVSSYSGYSCVVGKIPSIFASRFVIVIRHCSQPSLPWPQQLSEVGNRWVYSAVNRSPLMFWGRATVAHLYHRGGNDLTNRKICIATTSRWLRPVRLEISSHTLDWK